MLSNLRRRMFNTGSTLVDQALNGLAQDAYDFFAALIPLDMIEFTAVYTSPLPVGFDHEPKMLLAGRVRQDASPETAVAGDARVPFVWDAPNKRMLATVNGCSAGTKYRFAFLAVG